MVNSGVFNRQWKLRPIGSYHNSALSTLSSPKLSQAHSWIPKAKKWLRNHRKTANYRAKKDWLNKENITFLWVGGVSQNERILSENGRLEIFAEIGRFPAKTGGLKSLFILALTVQISRRVFLGLYAVSRRLIWREAIS